MVGGSCGSGGGGDGDCGICGGGGGGLLVVVLRTIHIQDINFALNTCVNVWNPSDGMNI